MAELWQCCTAVIRALLTHSGVSGEQIVGIGISARGKGLFLLIKTTNRSVTPFCPRIAGRWKSFVAGRKMASGKLYPLTRQTLWTGHPVSLLRWLKEHKPNATRNWLRDDDARLPALVFNRRQGCEESNISESNLYNMGRGNMTRTLPTGWGSLKSITPCRLLSDLPKSGGNHRSDSRTDRSESGYPPLSAACLMWFPPHSAPGSKTNSPSMR